MAYAIVYFVCSLPLVLGGTFAHDMAPPASDSLHVSVHAASDEAVDGWTQITPDTPPHNKHDLWISPEQVSLDVSAWESLVFRIENNRPVLIGTPDDNGQEALRTLLTEHDASHIAVVMDERVLYASQIMSIHGTARSIKLFGLSPREAARFVEGWHDVRM